MKIIKTIKDLRNELSNKESVGFVPTMGALHEGHARLIKKSVEDNSVSVVSIFVNPMQFNNKNDFETYPDTLENDINLLERLNVDYLFLPNASDIYKPNDNIRVTDDINSKLIEGEKRPGHFDGVLTVVLKLFNIVKPTRAYFGEKDFQQLSMVKSMVDSLFLDTEVVGVETKRDEAGLPFSSRNLKLSSKGYKKAQKAAVLFQKAKSADKAKKTFKDEGIDYDYVEEKWGRLLAVYKIEGIRILDNKDLLPNRIEEGVSL